MAYKLFIRRVADHIKKDREAEKHNEHNITCRILALVVLISSSVQAPPGVPGTYLVSSSGPGSGVMSCE